MKCKSCGAESRKYPLCRECYKKERAGSGFHAGQGQEEPHSDESRKFLYELKASLVTETERKFLDCIKSVLPEGYQVQPQVNLASFIVRTDGARFQNELYRNVDFMILDFSYKPLILIEINDQTHLSPERRERDKKVDRICEEAGIPIIKLWTSYGVNPEYIKKRIVETLAMLPVERISHFEEKKREEKLQTEAREEKKKGCYIATCVYGSYDCPEVWTLRRFRDKNLEKCWFGRAFIKVYYKASPVLVKCFGENIRFQRFFRWFLDALTAKLQAAGMEASPYED